MASFYRRATSVDDAEVVRANTVTTTELPSVVTVDDVDSQTPVTVAPSSSPLSTGLVIQIIGEQAISVQVHNTQHEIH